MAELVSLIIGILGVAGIVFTAMRWRRDDTTAVVTQQAELFGEMRTITDQLRIERADLKDKLDDCMGGR